MKKYVCELNQCAACGACVDICKKEAITIVDELKYVNAVIDVEKCVDCNACHMVCPNNHPVTFRKQLAWYQGWSLDAKERTESSSGGFAIELGKQFIRDGGFVCSCLFEDGEFAFRMAKREEEINLFRGSKYVKSNPKGIYKEIKTQLKNGNKVLFIGLPCQVAAVTNYVGDKLRERLFTVDLICHGTPSSMLLNLYLKQQGILKTDIKHIAFRSENNTFNLQVNHQNLEDPRIQDRYTMAFLSSLTYTENCYSCKYAQEERVSDITIGDSWGSELAEEEVKKGISLILCQTEKGIQLVKNLPFHMEEVDLDNAVANNHQLHHPSKVPDMRDFFFDKIEKGKKFDRIVAKIYSKECIKQDIKKIMKKFKLY